MSSLQPRKVSPFFVFGGHLVAGCLTMLNFGQRDEIIDMMLAHHLLIITFCPSCMSQIPKTDPCIDNRIIMTLCGLHLFPKIFQVWIS